MMIMQKKLVSEYSIKILISLFFPEKDFELTAQRETSALV